MTMPAITLEARDTGAMTSNDRSDDPPAKPKRRTFTADYKLSILGAYEAADAHERGAILRREGLYSSHISEWRKARDRGRLAGRRRPRRTAAQTEADKLRRKNEQLEAELARTKLALEIAGKASALLELLSESADTDPKSTT